MAKLSEQTERFDEMLDYMKKILDMSKELKDEERNLLSIAYKNYVSQRRTAWRIKILGHNKILFKKIESEMEKACTEILQILDVSLIPNSSSAEAKIFYYKMKGDYNRYLSEFSSGQLLQKASSEAIRSYEDAINILDQNNIRKDDALRLGISLNHSVMYYEIKDDLKSAIKIAKQAFQDALQELEDIEEEKYKDSTTIMQLLRDNLTVWQNELDEQNERNMLK
ncbi:hypothetical protein IMG5_187340 [Ichthyophthirius multifiliis]|uniref:14-3-3 domain-containing protein n=1 Tax=Ichthyophthirius multifiliis TaxID=5932 RepID=G0R3S3_ICHMU|nr:hypothetical protein IMG5_187340 [Ichthyophthirius multifiliis]EGR27890.1 hypothetical protein IMG5_187340 [Ichthyophthirius multifiliis]|eukprot:XP_004027235.1 hypothetical protein IMG5_187340 [Ichthyophthirius multifiliis]